MNNIKLTALCLQITILGYTNTDHRCFITQNLILLIFKFYEYKPRVSANLIFSASCHKLVKIKNLDKGTALTNQIKLVCVCIVYIYTYMYICKCIYICVCKYVLYSLKKLKKTWCIQKKIIIYRKCFAVWRRMQIIQNKKKHFNKTILNNWKRVGFLYIWLFSVINFTFKLLNCYCYIFYFASFSYCTFLLLFFNF